MDQHPSTLPVSGLARQPLPQLTPGPCLGPHWAWGAFAHQHFLQIPQPVSKLISITHIPAPQPPKYHVWTENLVESGVGPSCCLTAPPPEFLSTWGPPCGCRAAHRWLPLSALSRKQKLLRFRLALHVIYCYSSHRGIGTERGECRRCSVTKACLTETPWTAAPHAPCHSLFPGIYSNSCPLSGWCYPTISSSAARLLLLPSIFPSFRVFCSIFPCLYNSAFLSTGHWEKRQEAFLIYPHLC